MAGKTGVAITHCLSTIAALDRLAVLAAGRAVAQGSRAELLAPGALGSGSTPRRYPSYWLFTQPLHFDTCVDRTT